MDRRESMKSMLLGTLAGGLVLNGCKPEEKSANVETAVKTTDYGRTPEEKARDQKLLEEQFFTTAELETIAVLCDLILPANENFGSATDAGVHEFIEFIAKDIPSHKTPLR